VTDSKDLVERLRAISEVTLEPIGTARTLIREAADRIETLEWLAQDDKPFQAEMQKRAEVAEARARDLERDLSSRQQLVDDVVRERAEAAEARVRELELKLEVADESHRIREAT
jgi:hypothetical protein